MLFLASFSDANLIITPQRIESTVKPNEPIKGSYSVTNNYDDDVQLEVYIDLNKEWSYKKNLDIPLDSWLKIMPSRMTIRKGETKLVLYTISPDGGMQGSVAGQVKFKVNPPANPTVTALISLPIHIIMQGTEKIEYGIDSLAIDNRTKKLNIGIKNNSNIIIKPIGFVDIYSGSKKVRTVQLPETVSVFPGTVRNEFDVKMPADLEPGKYRAEVSIRLIGYSHYVKPVVRSMQFRVLKDGSVI